MHLILSFLLLAAESHPPPNPYVERRFLYIDNGREGKTLASVATEQMCLFIAERLNEWAASPDEEAPLKFYCGVQRTYT